MNPTYRLLALTAVVFILGCGIGAATLALWAYWETERRLR